MGHPDQDIRYLAAKEHVDDRSLNRQVWDSVWRPWEGRRVRILELGAGIGTMVERVLDRAHLDHADYTAIDINPTLLSEARQRLAGWGQRQGYASDESQGRLAVSGPRGSLRLQTMEADVRAGLPAELKGQFDVVIACAFLDLVDLEQLVPEILGLLADGGAFYFPINFDGVTTFMPAIDPEIDSAIERSYHLSMDQRDGDGGSHEHSHTGRRLLTLLPLLGAEISAAGSSDWILHPTAGAYHPDDQLVLAWMLDSVERSVGERGEIDPGVFAAWVAERRRQLDQGSLTLITHQMDVGGVPHL